MWFHGWAFWLVPLILFLVITRRRRWERWAAAGAARERGPAGRDVQQAYIDALESRVTQLEERLDFTERLLAGRNG
jgi:hypothetical protein